MTDTSETKAPERLEVKQFIDAAQLRKDIAFSTSDLDSAMMGQASLFVYYGVLLAKASRQVDSFKVRLEIAEAFVYRKLRDELVKSGEKFSEPMLAAAVSKSLEVRQIKVALNEAKQIESVAKTAVEGFRHRRDMLVQQGLLQREELKGELTIAKKQAAEDVRANAKDDLFARLKEIDQSNAG